MKERMKEQNLIIYKVENTENGMVYIGATTIALKERKKDHLQRVNKSYSGKFQEAISSYGEEAFEWVQIDTANSIDELATKEKEYIAEYNSKEEGYNNDSGGGFKKTIYQYNQDGGLIDTYECLEKAGEIVNATKQDISRACLSVNKTFGGYYWSYEYIEPFKPNKDFRKKIVLCYNLKGEKVYDFNSISEASKSTAINKSSIAKVCRGERKTAGGYFWKFN